MKRVADVGLIVHRQGQGLAALGQEQGGVEEAGGRAEARAGAIEDTKDCRWCAIEVEQDVGSIGHHRNFRSNPTCAMRNAAENSMQEHEQQLTRA